VKPRFRLGLMLAIGTLLIGGGIYLRFWGSFSPIVPARQRPPRPKTGKGLEEYRAEIAAAYRLKPDRRALRAAEDILRICGKGEDKFSAVFEDKEWRVRSASGKFEGTLPKIADFDAIMGFLRKVAALAAKDGLLTEGNAQVEDIADRMKSFNGVAVIEAMREIDRLWAEGHRDQELLRLAAWGFGLLVFQTSCDADIADPLVARGLASLALHKELSGRQAMREEMLLSAVMDHWAHASRLAGASAPDDPIVCHVNKDEAGLTRLAEAGSPLAQYAHLYLISCGTDAPDTQAKWNAAAEIYCQGSADPRKLLPVVALRSTMGGLGVKARAAREAMELATKCAEAEAAGGPAARPTGLSSPGEMCGRFERAVAVFPEGGGPLMDGEILVAFYRAAFYGALLELAFHERRIFSSVAASRALLREIDPGLGGPVAEFHAWFSHLVSVKAGKPDIPGLEADLEETSWIDGYELYATYNALARRYEIHEPKRYGVVRAYAARLDARPKYVMHMGNIAFYGLTDIGMSHELLDEACRLYGSRAVDIRVGRAIRNADVPELRRILGLTRLPWEAYRSVMRARRSRLLDDNSLGKAFEKVLGELPGLSCVVEEYADYLIEKGDTRRAREVVQSWIDREEAAGRTGGLAMADALIIVSKSMALEGRLEDALEAAKRAAGTFKATSQVQLGSILEQSGRTAEALEMAETASRRYPDRLQVAMFRARLLWRSGRNADAARSLVSFARPITFDDWLGEVADEFVESFSDRTDQTADAVRALLDAGIDPAGVACISNRFWRDEKYQEAYESFVPFIEKWPGGTAVRPIGTW